VSGVRYPRTRISACRYRARRPAARTRRAHRTLLSQANNKSPVTGDLRRAGICGRPTTKGPLSRRSGLCRYVLTRGTPPLRPRSKAMR
jgi:hypothetical protein